MSSEIVMNGLEQAFLDADLGLTDIYASWFEANVDEDIPEAVQDIIFLHFRSAYLAGRIQGQQDIMPIVMEHSDKLAEIAEMLRDE